MLAVNHELSAFGTAAFGVHRGGVHVNYGEAVVRVHDGLPKQKDFPKEMGGSGITLPD